MAGSSLEFNAMDFRRELMSSTGDVGLGKPHTTETHRGSHVPPTHSKALLPDCSIVEGMRGAGKSFWTAVLANEDA